jgi:hypothetical protein
MEKIAVEGMGLPPCHGRTLDTGPMRTRLITYRPVKIKAVRFVLLLALSTCLRGNGFSQGTFVNLDFEHPITLLMPVNFFVSDNRVADLQKPTARQSVRLRRQAARTRLR